MLRGIPGALVTNSGKVIYLTSYESERGPQLVVWDGPGSVVRRFDAADGLEPADGELPAMFGVKRMLANGRDVFASYDGPNFMSGLVIINTDDGTWTDVSSQLPACGELFDDETITCKHFWDADISDDGRWLADSVQYSCSATDEDCLGSSTAAFLFDRSGVEQPRRIGDASRWVRVISMSRDGSRTLVNGDKVEQPFHCRSFVYERASGALISIERLPDDTEIPPHPETCAERGEFSPDGATVAFLAPPETGTAATLFLRDLTGETTRVASLGSVNQAFPLGFGAIPLLVTNGGTYVWFAANAFGLKGVPNDGLGEIILSRLPAPYAVVASVVARD
ncbi:hypothetical protein AYO38_09360 [bacterium SCGC AG-212-C10]|nr:hypothetical protein AYO38_09360 [bacterium SCGC AG-212-C10]